MRQKPRWQLAHQENCGCGAIPKNVQDYLKHTRSEVKLTQVGTDIDAEAASQHADWTVQSFWEQDVQVWQSYWVPTFRKFAHELVSNAELSQGKIVLDVGTGTGIAATEAAKQVKPGGVVLAIDRSKAMIRFAERNAAKSKIGNIVFFGMDASQMLFPNELFDAALSNCGITFAAYPKAVSEVFRVLRKGGLFVLNDWHLKDVGPHRTFGEVLQRYRTDNPSPKLRAERMALATYERTGSRYIDLRELVKELERVGFDEIRTLHRNHRIQFGSVQAVLDILLKREALKHELRELSPAERRLMNDELRRELKLFVRNRRFIFNWPVAYVSAQKPN